MTSRIESESVNTKKGSLDSFVRKESNLVGGDETDNHQ